MGCCVKRISFARLPSHKNLVVMCSYPFAMVWNTNIKGSILIFFLKLYPIHLFGYLFLSTDNPPTCMSFLIATCSGLSPLVKTSFSDCNPHPSSKCPDPLNLNSLALSTNLTGCHLLIGNIFFRNDWECICILISATSSFRLSLLK